MGASNEGMVRTRSRPAPVPGLSERSVRLEMCWHADHRVDLPGDVVRLVQLTLRLESGRIDGLLAGRIMRSMRSVPSTLLRSLLLFLAMSVSLGPLQCNASGMDDVGLLPACCARDGDGDPDNALSASEAGDVMTACAGACPGTAVAADVQFAVFMSYAAPASSAGPRLAGRTPRPEPHPPKRRLLI